MMSTLNDTYTITLSDVYTVIFGIKLVAYKVLYLYSKTVNFSIHIVCRGKSS